MRNFLSSIASVFTNAKSQNNQETNNTYAIQNVKTGKNLRAYKAGVEDGNTIILYKHAKWKCMTWQFIQVDSESYQLKNMYTSKTFQPSSMPEPGVTLWQQALKEDNLQYWEFIKQPDETYLVRLKGTSMYVTISSDKSNSSIILMPLQNSNSQQWKFIKQNPWL
ncbi:RICIN domain-containing protein [Bacillus wiedmannii]|uniref:RICIN domain-containing protein n=1 Tax=Bacillus wiedmannii TaxID=1890302 RepID=UPI003D9708CF